MSARWSETDLAQALRNPHVREARPSGRPPSPLDPDRGRVATAQSVSADTAAGAVPRGASKYGAIPTEGPTGAGHRRKYDSKTSARLAESLDRDKRAGLILDYTDEVSVIIGPRTGGGYVRARLDQLVLDGFTEDGRMIIRMLDGKRKGFDTPKGQAKHAALRQRGWKIEIIEV